MSEEILLTKRGKPRKAMGRPKKEKQGKHLWIPAEVLDTVLLIIQANKQKQVKQP